MKIGSIVLNKWAGENNPIRYFIYTGMTAKYANGIVCVDGQLRKTQFYKHDFLNSGMFEEVGYCNTFDIMKQDLRRAHEADVN